MWVSALIITALVSLNYAFLILFFRKGWNFLPKDITSSEDHTFVSILIPVRNEQENIPGLLNQLKDQSYPDYLFEILFINDHSTDDSVNLITQSTSQLKNVKLIHLKANETGKKRAIWKGIQNCSGKLLITLDADCLPTEKWLETIARFYQTYKPQMIIAPVIMNRKNNMLNTLFSLEFLSLQASTAGAAGNKQAIMCNGANLAFEKSLIEDISNIYKHPTASGDDMFLLEEVKRKGKEIRFCRSVDACVYTDPPETIQQFVSQRIRWAAKSNHYRDNFLKYTAISVFLMNFALPGILITSIIKIQNIYVFAGMILFKSLVDFILLNPVSKFFNQDSLLKVKYLITAQLLYPFYTVFIAIASQVSGFKWKNRHYNH